MTARRSKISGFDLYHVMDSGSVESFYGWRGYGPRYLNQSPNSFGYMSVRMINNDGKRRRMLVHKLVLEAFDSKRPKGMQARHLDGDKKNNSISNLAWGTAKENADDRERHGMTARGENHRNSKLTSDAVLRMRVLNKSGQSYSSLARAFDLEKSTVRMICLRKAWSHI